MNAEMAVCAEIISPMKKPRKDARPMAVLRTVVSALSLYDPKADDNRFEENRRKALLLPAKTPTITAAWERIRTGKEVVAPRPDLSLAANFLYMLKGTKPQKQEIAVLDAYLVLLSEHGMNASTFSARVTTITLSDMYSAITTPIGYLKGEAHDGAIDEAMAMILMIAIAVRAHPTVISH